jgi:uncharacterized protein (DUF1919 family)
MEHYLNCELEFVPHSENHITYPVARLDDITIYFQHYASKEDARAKWERRKKRLNPDSICCLLVERDGCTKDDLIRFSRLPYPTASLVHLPIPDVKNTYYIRGFEQDKEVGNSIDFRRNQYFGRRYYDDFNYVRFINEVKGR